MKRLVLLGYAGLWLAASTIAGAAQTQPAPSPAPPPTQPAPATQPEHPAPAERAAAASERTGPTDNQIADEVDARIAQLKANLRLTPEQDGKWSSLRDALRDGGIEATKRRYAADERMGRHRHDRRHQSDIDATGSTEQDRRSSDIAMMRLEADEMAAHANALKKIADAAEPLYDTLANRQRRILMRFIERGLAHGGG